MGFVSGGKKLKLDRGVVNKQLMHVTDWFPTLVGVAGGNLDGTKPLDGVDQWETLRYRGHIMYSEIVQLMITYEIQVFEMLKKVSARIIGIVDYILNCHKRKQLHTI